jgi:hypothetical protein
MNKIYKVHSKTYVSVGLTYQEVGRKLQKNHHIWGSGFKKPPLFEKKLKTHKFTPNCYKKNTDRIF